MFTSHCGFEIWGTCTTRGQHLVLPSLGYLGQGSAIFYCPPLASSFFIFNISCCLFIGYQNVFDFCLKSFTTKITRLFKSWCGAKGVYCQRCLMISLWGSLPADRTTIASAGLVSLLHRQTDRSHLPAISVLGDLAAVFCTPKQALIFLISHFKKKDNMLLVLLVHLRHQVLVLLHFQLHSLGSINLLQPNVFELPKHFEFQSSHRSRHNSNLPRMWEIFSLQISGWRRSQQPSQQKKWRFAWDANSLDKANSSCCFKRGFLG